MSWGVSVRRMYLHLSLVVRSANSGVHITERMLPPFSSRGKGVEKWGSTLLCQKNLHVLIADTQILDLLTESKDLTNQED